MTNFRDPTGIGRAATIALCAYMIFKGLVAVTRFFTLPGYPPNAPLAVLYPAATIACYILVGCWIYRTNANAHLVDADEMTITPGWSVGWFFIPFLNLVMPYRGVNETWQATQKAAGGFEALRSPLVGWWWGLWLADNIVSNIGAFLGSQGTFARNGSMQINLVAAGIAVAASLVLIQLISRLNRAQLVASRGNVFA